MQSILSKFRYILIIISPKFMRVYVYIRFYLLNNTAKDTGNDQMIVKCFFKLIKLCFLNLMILH